MTTTIEAFGGRQIKHLEDISNPFDIAYISGPLSHRVAIIPSGCVAKLRIDKILYIIADFRDQGENSRHKPGARIEGAGVVVTLDPYNTINAIDRNIFSYSQNQPESIMLEASIFPFV